MPLFSYQIRSYVPRCVEDRVPFRATVLPGLHGPIEKGTVSFRTRDPSLWDRKDVPFRMENERGSQGIPTRGREEVTRAEDSRVPSDMATRMRRTVVQAMRRCATTAVEKGEVEARKGLDLPPASLEVPAKGIQLREDVQQNPFLRALVWAMGYYSKESSLLRASENLMDATKAQMANERVFLGERNCKCETKTTTPTCVADVDEPRRTRIAAGLPRKFATRHGLYCLHIWLLLDRLRAEGRDGTRLTQMTYDKFQSDVELLVRKEGVKVRVSKWLKELEKNFYGACVAYDKAMKDEDQLELQRSLYRNVYHQEGDEENAAFLAKYVRREVKCLALTDSKAMLAGHIQFSDLAPKV